MFASIKKIGFNFKYWGLLALTAGALIFSQPAPASAHCDSVNGPVVAAAQAALEQGDVKLV